MVHFRSKNDIIQWLEKYCPRRAIVRSLNNTELLGGFDPIPPTTRAGWVVRVTSKYNMYNEHMVMIKKRWIVAIIPYKGKPDCEIRILKEVPWKSWIGKSHWWRPICGDKPGLYAAMRERAKEA